MQKGYETYDTQAVNNSSEEKLELSSQREFGKKRRSFRRREKHLILCPGPHVVSQRGRWRVSNEEKDAFPN